MSYDLEDENAILKQRIKRYQSAFEYLLKKADEQIEKNDETNIEASILAYEIIKVIKDTESYSFDL